MWISEIPIRKKLPSVTLISALTNQASEFMTGPLRLPWNLTVTHVRFALPPLIYSRTHSPTTQSPTPWIFSHVSKLMMFLLGDIATSFPFFDVIITQRQIVQQGSTKTCTVWSDSYPQSVQSLHLICNIIIHNVPKVLSYLALYP